MKTFLIKYLTVLGILTFGFLGGALFVKKDHVSQQVLGECEQTAVNMAKEVKECKENFVQLFFLYVELKEKGVKK